jgi:PUA-domain protein
LQPDSGCAFRSLQKETIVSHLKMPKIEKIKKRHLLKKREQKAELDRIESDTGSAIDLDVKMQLESGVLDDGSSILLLNGEIVFFESDGRVVPTLRALLSGIISIPKITVDMGAVKYVVNGADIMRPGITEVDDDVRQNGIVVIVDERHGKPLAVGISILDATDLRAATSGKVVKSIHHVNDRLWDFSKQ